MYKLISLRPMAKPASFKYSIKKKKIINCFICKSNYLYFLHNIKKFIKHSKTSNNGTNYDQGV